MEGVLLSLINSLPGFAAGMIAGGLALFRAVDKGTITTKRHADVVGKLSELQTKMISMENTLLRVEEENKEAMLARQRTIETLERLTQELIKSGVKHG